MLKFLFKTVIFLIAILSLTVAYSRYIEPCRLIITEISAETGISAAAVAADSIKVAVFSDTHFSEYYTLDNFKNVIAAINNRAPDIILFCGDLIDNYGSYMGNPETISGALSELTAPMGKYAVFGNHDYGGGARNAYGEIMESGGFVVLRNEFVRFDEMKLNLIGLDDFIFRYGDANLARSGSLSDYFNFLFCHEPDIIDSILDSDVDFMTAGHTHGGQINIPGYTHIYYPPYGQNYTKGVYRFENDRQTTLYVNSGLGTTKLPFRFMSAPEITFITLQYQS